MNDATTSTLKNTALSSLGTIKVIRIPMAKIMKNHPTLLTMASKSAVISPLNDDDMPSKNNTAKGSKICMNAYIRLKTNAIESRTTDTLSSILIIFPP